MALSPLSFPPFPTLWSWWVVRKCYHPFCNRSGRAPSFTSTSLRRRQKMGLIAFLSRCWGLLLLFTAGRTNATHWSKSHGHLAVAITAKIFFCTLEKAGSGEMEISRHLPIHLGSNFFHFKRCVHFQSIYSSSNWMKQDKIKKNVGWLHHCDHQHTCIFNYLKGRLFAARSTNCPSLFLVTLWGYLTRPSGTATILDIPLPYPSKGIHYLFTKSYGEDAFSNIMNALMLGMTNGPLLYSQSGAR